LMLNLGGATGTVFGIWMLVGFLIYFGYSRRHSRVGTMSDAAYRESLDA
ncbi:amino acid permease, partial [Burkholderia multivorans]